MSGWNISLSVKRTKESGGRRKRAEEGMEPCMLREPLEEKRGEGRHVCRRGERVVDNDENED